MQGEQQIPDKQAIADALWLDEFNWDALPTQVQEAVTSSKHSATAFGERMRSYTQWLQDHPQSFNPNYTKRYRQLTAAVGELTPHQAYILGMNTLGKNASQEFEKIPETPNIRFPRDNAVQLRNQIGWHFFVGSVWAEDGQEYGVELMFFGTASLPSPLAQKAGLTDHEDQIIEIQLAISKAGERHHQADPIVVAGTSGLFDCSGPDEPLRFVLGKNFIRSVGKGKELFPLHIQAHGIDRGGEQPFELGIDLKLTSDRPVLYQGQDGAMPSLAGFGTLYYSIPGLTLKDSSSITYGGKRIKLKKGLMWFDHQWGFLNGNPDAPVVRASVNMSARPAPGGWDWYMQQFDGNRQITVFKGHSNEFRQFYFQSGPTPPGTMTVSVAGKYMDEQGDTHDTWGTLVIDSWAQALTTPNPALYPVTRVWHPNHWQFTFDDTVPADIREFTMEQIVPAAQTNFFANGAQYNEGAVYLKNPEGKLIGRGFAEAVAYANTADNAYRLLGFDNNLALVRTLKIQVASFPRRFVSFLYLITHTGELKRVLQRAKGMKFLGPRPKDSVTTRHSR